MIANRNKYATRLLGETNFLQSQNGLTFIEEYLDFLVLLIIGF